VSTKKKKYIYILVIMVFFISMLGRAFYVSYKDKLATVTIISEWNKHGKPVDVFKLEKSDMVFYTKVSGAVNGPKIRSYVPSGIRSKLEDGQIFFIEQDGKKIKGIVDDVYDQRDKQSGLFLVELRITDKVNLVRGSIITANIQSRKTPGLLCVPTESVERSDNKTYVWVVDGERKASKREVELGISNGQKYQLLSGVNPGEMVVTSGKDFLLEGDTVMVHRTFDCIDEI
jgi:hypothetical protein